MFNLNENNRMYIRNQPTDMRMGVNCLCGKVREAGLSPTSGGVFIFAGKSRKVLKTLHRERGGYALYYKRLEQGHRFPVCSPKAKACSGQSDGTSSSLSLRASVLMRHGANDIKKS